MLQRQESSLSLQREQVYQLVNLQFNGGHVFPQDHKVQLVKTGNVTTDLYFLLHAPFTCDVNSAI